MKSIVERHEKPEGPFPRPQHTARRNGMRTRPWPRRSSAVPSPIPHTGGEGFVSLLCWWLRTAARQPMATLDCGPESPARPLLLLTHVTALSAGARLGAGTRAICAVWGIEAWGIELIASARGTGCSLCLQNRVRERLLDKSRTSIAGLVLCCCAVVFWVWCMREVQWCIRVSCAKSQEPSKHHHPPPIPARASGLLPEAHHSHASSPRACISTLHWPSTGAHWCCHCPRPAARRPLTALLVVWCPQ